MTDRKISELHPSEVGWWIAQALVSIRPERRQDYIEAIDEAMRQYR